jgi:hypothetical protein
VKQALSAIEPLALEKLRDKASNLDLHGQSVASCLLDDPGSQGTVDRALRPPRAARSTQRHGRSHALSSYGTFARSRTMLFKPLANPSTLDRRHAASYVEELWSPALLRFRIMCKQKPKLIQQRILLRRKRRGTFLSQAGPRVQFGHFS